ncbi:MAG: M23 family metallopeptidase [Oscillospiraceae bacterium]|nr:M23 family metallopeptidase [Oscillospiraceae bacterium]
MKNKRQSESQKTKWLAIMTAAGSVAVCAAVIAAYSVAMNNLVPTNNRTDLLGSSSYSSSSSSKPDTPVNNPSVTVPKDNNSSSSSASSKPDDTEPANNPVNTVKGNIMPVEGDVDIPFSNGELVKSPTLGVWKTHDGSDILCPLGTDVKSMSDGVVKEIRDDALMGIYVVIEQTNGLEVHYCGLAKELSVKAGTVVAQGEIIGKTSDTNQSEILQQPHLHLAVKKSGEWIDPMSVIS